MFIEPPSIVTCSDHATLSNFDEVLPSLMQGYFKGMTLRASGDSSRYRGRGSKVLPMRFYTRDGWYFISIICVPYFADLL